MRSFRLARSGRKLSSKQAPPFEDLVAAISAEAGWIVTTDVPTPPLQGSAASNEADVILVFDGGARGNPGEGYGSFAYKGRVVRWQTHVAFPGKTTNNQAEYQTLVAGLRAIIFDCQALAIPPGDLRIEIWSDSQLVVNQVNGKWKIKNAGLRKLQSEVLANLESFAKWTLIWHPRSESVRILGH